MFSRLMKRSMAVLWPIGPPNTCDGAMRGEEAAVTAHHKMADSVGVLGEDFIPNIGAVGDGPDPEMSALTESWAYGPRGLWACRNQEASSSGLDGSAASERTPSPAGVESEAHFGRYGRVAWDLLSAAASSPM